MGGSRRTTHKWTEDLPISKPLGDRGWVVRAVAPDTTPCHVYDLSNTCIVSHLASTRAPKRCQHAIARAGCDIRPALSKWSKDAGVVGQPPAQSEIAKTQLDSLPRDKQGDSKSQDEAGDASMAPGEKRESDTHGLSVEKKGQSRPCGFRCRTFWLQLVRLRQPRGLRLQLQGSCRSICPRIR